MADPCRGRGCSLVSCVILMSAVAHEGTLKPTPDSMTEGLNYHSHGSVNVSVCVRERERERERERVPGRGPETEAEKQS